MRFLLAIGLALLLVGCGGSGADSNSSGQTWLESLKAEDNQAVQAYSGDWGGLKKAAGGSADRLLIPTGPSPDKVVIKDLREGSGAPIRPGDVFAVRYVDFDYETGEQRERNWSQRSPWRLTWQIGELVDGWEPGLKGIKAGGLRELIVPSQLAYENGPRVYLVEIAYIERK
jgi:peptidylprolyl isomerase